MWMELAANIFLYTVSHNEENLRWKGETYIVRPNGNAAAGKTLKIARLQFGGNWDPSPAGGSAWPPSCTTATRRTWT